MGSLGFGRQALKPMALTALVRRSQWLENLLKNRALRCQTNPAQGACLQRGRCRNTASPLLWTTSPSRAISYLPTPQPLGATMLWVLRAVVVAVLLSSTVVVHGQDAFPPIGDRYKSPPSEAKDVIKALKKLRARTDIGINFVDYDKAISDVLPEVKVFIGSDEAKPMPEVRLLLGNAMDCYLKVRDIWGKSISSSSPSAKYDASVLLITARPTLWKIADTNVTGAIAFLEGTPEELPKAQETLTAGLGNLTVEAGLALAEAELCNLDRQNRAKESGVAVPPADANAESRDLAAIIYADGEFGDSVTAGPLKKRLPPVYSKVPPAVQEGRIPLLEGGETCGGVAGFIYSDTKVAKQALDAIAGGFGDDKQRVKGLGDAAVGVHVGGASSVSLVFRRGPMVVSLVSPVAPLAKSVAAAQNIDKRIVELFPEAESQDSEKEEMAAEGDGASLADMLFQDGDLGDAISGSPFTEKVAFIFSEIGGAAEQGEVKLTNLGERVGGINGFTFENEKDAKVAFEKIAAGIGSTGAKVPGVGNAAYGSRMPISGSQDIVFRRGGTVVHIRAPSKNLAELTKVAKKIDSRVRKVSQPKAIVK